MNFANPFVACSSRFLFTLLLANHIQLLLIASEQSLRTEIEDDLLVLSLCHHGTTHRFVGDGRGDAIRRIGMVATTEAPRSKNTFPTVGKELHYFIHK